MAHPVHHHHHHHHCRSLSYESRYEIITLVNATSLLSEACAYCFQFIAIINRTLLYLRIIILTYNIVCSLKMERGQAHAKVVEETNDDNDVRGSAKASYLNFFFLKN